MRWLKLRHAEWILVCFFAYIAVISPFFTGRPNLRWQPLFVFGGVLCFLGLLSRVQESNWNPAIDFARDWLPLVLTLAAFREMELFIPAKFLHQYEPVWHGWDHYILSDVGLRRAVEALGSLLPAYLEFCYLLVYGVGAFCVALLYVAQRRGRIDSFLSIYLAGTLGAYALFPFFPSQPPRFLYPEADLPQVVTALRTFNVWILKQGTIHSSVFPSAHVSAAFSCAWAMFLCLPEKKAYAWGLLVYAMSVSLATVYGRYHYAADVAAGIAVSVLAGLIGLALKHRKPHQAINSVKNGLS